MKIFKNILFFKDINHKTHGESRLFIPQVLFEELEDLHSEFKTFISLWLLAHT
ncbi:hypothetical protein [Pantoea vagans]|uniref:hypothetical protein n=1 Tax=Pantoea vagans TaxID=470934 RepID=UPI0023B02AC8|nr:hypothetical protein [Pantoea vagans]